MDTGSEYSWHAKIRGGAGNDEPAGGAGDGAARGAGDGAAGGAGGGGPLPPPDPPPSDHTGAGGRRMSRRQQRIKQLEFTKPITFTDPINFFGNAGEDFDTWSILVQVYIEDQPENLQKDE
jgi:hypothetical protein